MSKSSASIEPLIARTASDSTYSDAQLLLAARLYYIDGMLQSQIAKMVGVSQAKVSRMLAVARERGIVHISVPEYEPRDQSLEQSLVERFGLAAAVVVRSIAGQPLAELRNTIGYFAAPVVAGWLAASRSVAIAGGRTLQRLADALPGIAPPAPLTVVQAMGNVDATPGAYDAVEIGRTFARRTQGNLLTLNTPAFVPTAAVGRQLLALKEIAAVFERLSHADTALVGVGNLENSVFIERGVLKPRDIEALRKAGAVGEILGRFFDANGRECKTPFRDRVISMPLAQLRRTANVVAVVAGEDRTLAVRAALRGGLVKSLVLDGGAAAAL